MTSKKIAERTATGKLTVRYRRLFNATQFGAALPITGRQAAPTSVRTMIETTRAEHLVQTAESALDDETARGIWAVQDGLVLEGGQDCTDYRHYHEGCRGGWQIASSKLTCLHHQQADPLQSQFRDGVGLRTANNVEAPTTI